MIVPVEVAAAWGWDPAEIGPLPGGLLNATYQVAGPVSEANAPYSRAPREAIDQGQRPLRSVPRAVLQRLHPVFAPEVNLDIEVITTHLAARGLVTPLLLRTRAGAACFEHAGRVWRALTWIDGATVHEVPDPSWAEAGGELVGRFHTAVADLDHAYAFTRAGVHDTPAHLARLQSAVDGGGDPDHVALGAEILAAARELPALPAVPRRHCHGDLKISNVLFDTSPPRAVCLVDLDTIGYSTLAFEIGDAMRSWCNPRGEDTADTAFDLAIFEAAMRGFRRTAAAVVAPVEWRAIVVGLETVCVELAARFAVDVFRDEYFGWDAARFASRRAHNLVRARGQLALALAVRAVRAEALAIAGGK